MMMQRVAAGMVIVGMIGLMIGVGVGAGATKLGLWNEDLGQSWVVLGWNHSKDGNAFASYVLLMDEGGGFHPVYSTSKVDETSHRVEGLSAGHAYSFKVRDVDRSGNEQDSDILQITTKPPSAPGFEAGLALAAIGLTWVMGMRRKSRIVGGTPLGARSEAEDVRSRAR